MSHKPSWAEKTLNDFILVAFAVLAWYWFAEGSAGASNVVRAYIGFGFTAQLLLAISNTPPPPSTRSKWRNRLEVSVWVAVAIAAIWHGYWLSGAAAFWAVLLNVARRTLDEQTESGVV